MTTVFASSRILRHNGVILTIDKFRSSIPSTQPTQLDAVSFISFLEVKMIFGSIPNPNPNLDLVIGVKISRSVCSKVIIVSESFASIYETESSISSKHNQIIFEHPNLIHSNLNRVTVNSIYHSCKSNYHYAVSSDKQHRIFQVV